MTEAGIKQIINQMLIEGILEVTKDKYALLRTTDKAEKVLIGEYAVVMKELKKTPVYESDKNDRMRSGVSGSSGCLYAGHTQSRHSFRRGRFREHYFA